MLNEKILEFYREFQDEVLNYVKENSPISTNIAFKTLFLSYLTEAGETLVSDCALVDFKKDGENMKLDGYAFSEYFHSLTLLVSKYQAKPQPEKIKKTEIGRKLQLYRSPGNMIYQGFVFWVILDQLVNEIQFSFPQK